MVNLLRHGFYSILLTLGLSSLSAQAECTTSYERAEALMKAKLSLSLMDATWTEERPQLPPAGHLSFVNRGGNLAAELKGSESYGVVAATLCLHSDHLQLRLQTPSMRISGLRRVRLLEQLKKSQNGQSDFWNFRLTRHSAGRVQIEDSTGYINSPFSRLR